MRRNIQALALAGVAFAAAVGIFATPFAAQTAEAARVEKVGVCHFAEDEGRYEYIEVPAKQFEPTRKGHPKGHARHAAEGRDLMGLSEEACLALNQAR